MTNCANNGRKYGAAMTCPTPTSDPKNTPTMNPRIDFPSPSIRFQSRKTLPPSIGRPPPPKTGVALAIHADNPSQIDNSKRASSSYIE